MPNDPITGTQLHNWRRERSINQAELAKALGVSRQTIINWERNHTHIPFSVPEKLAVLAYTLMPKPIVAPPDYLNRDSATLRPDLDLFGPKTRNGPGGFGSEHPAVLLPDLLPKKPGLHRIPWSVLESPEYKAALRRKRGEL